MLTIDRLTLQLPYYPRWWRREWTTCIESLSLHLPPGEVHAVVVRQAQVKACWPTPLWGYCPKRHGSQESCASRGKDLTPARQRQLRGHQLALIPQSLNALDPLARSQHQVRWAAQRAGFGRSAAHQRADELLSRYQLSLASTHYPHELSGRHGAAGAHRYGPGEQRTSGDCR
ncbi:hypothetical protein HAALTHF_47660n [Vreelandella aquamarina]|nr:hypothetical protein HAALTHF_47660n [Halomonas axialensis]